MAAAWPERAGDPFADRMNALPKHVVSSTLGDDEFGGGKTIFPGDGGLRTLRLVSTVTSGTG